MAEALDSLPDKGREVSDLICGSITPCPWIRRVNWTPFCNHGDACHGVEDFDLKRMSEQTAELEKDLIVKELEALDVLEKLGSTKRMVEDLKRQLQNEVSSFHTAAAQEQMSSPSHANHGNNYEQPVSSQDLILMELQKANLNLGKTITDLKRIQTSVEVFNMKMEKGKNFQEELKQILNSEVDGGEKCCFDSIQTAKLKWVAAKKMEEAARAAGILALAEMQALKGNEILGEFCLQDESNSNSSKLGTVKMLKEATQKLNLNRVEQRRTPDHQGQKELAVYCSNTPDAFHGSSNLNNVYSSTQKGSSLTGLTRPDAINSDKMPVIRPTISMRDVLSKKQVLSEEYRARKDDGHGGIQKVALRQMLREMREDLTTFPSKAEKDGNTQKNFISERKKFGFIHISLPVTKPSKKKTRPLNTI